MTNTLFLNAAWRQREGRLHPYAGLGVGGGIAKIKVDSPLLTAEEDTVQAGIQGFIGVDYDLTERLYAGASARVFYIDGRIIGDDIQFLEIMLLGNIGVRF